MRPDCESLVRRSNESKGYGRRLQVPAGLTLALTLLLSPTAARADDGSRTMHRVISPRVFVGGPRILIPMRPIGHFAPAGRVGGGPSGGVFVGVDTGVALALASGFDPAQDAWAFGGRAGYEFRNGLALQLRYDYLGLAPHLTNPSTSPMQIGSAASSYSIPFLVPLPFFEAMWGPSFNAGSVRSRGGRRSRGLRPHRPARAHRCFGARLDHADRRPGPDPHVELGAAVSFASPGH